MEMISMKLVERMWFGSGRNLIHFEEISVKLLHLTAMRLIVPEVFYLTSW